jgi:BirA family transcriptional regulator, biotin operon repressor / biotin---[acetyl-CoA-carboxylase] ligase
MNDTFTESEILAALKTRRLGRPTYYLPETESTNDLLREMSAGESGRLPSGTLVIADYQRRGKGRLGRRWEAPPATSLLFSLLFRLDWPAEQATWLTMMGSLAAVTAIEQATALEAAIKWPNDLLTGTSAGGWRKVGGLLLEGDFDEHGRLRTAVLGIGINVNVAAAQLPEGPTPATSLLVESGRPVNRLHLLADLLQRLETMVEATPGQTPQPRWHERLVTLGQAVQVTSAPGKAAHSSLSGIAEGTDAWGRLLVRDEAGTLHTISAGDVTLRA